MREQVKTQNDEPTSKDLNLISLQRLPSIAVSRSPSYLRDVLMLFIIPGVLLTAIFMTTEPGQFEYKVADPTLWGIYSSNLAHRSWSHLLSNLLGLILICGVEYLVLTAAGYRSHVIGLFLGSLLIFPLYGHLFLQFVLINQPIFRTYEAVGYSEPIAAMTGFLPLAITIYLSRAREFRWPLLWALFLYAGGVAWAIGNLFGFDIPTVLVGGLGLIGVIWIIKHVFHATEVRQERAEYAGTVLFLLVLYGFGLHGLFSGQAVGSMVGHLAGFLPGFFLPMIFLWGFSLAKPGHNQAVNLE